MADNVPTQKSWFSKPEGKVGAVLPVIGAIAGVCGLVFAWGTVVPWVILMLQNTLTAAALAIGVGACVVVVSDKRWRNLGFYAYKSLMRGLTSLFIEIDPIGILKTYVESLKEKLSEMDASIDNLSGQLNKLKNQIDKNEKSRIHSLEIAQEAQKKDIKNVFVLQARQAGRLEKSNVSLQDLYNKMLGLLKFLRKVRETSSFMIDDIQGEVDVKTQERSALLAGYGAFTKAKKIMQGGGDDADIFNMTMERLTEEYGIKVGEIDSFMEMSEAMIKGVDVENGIFESNALKQLEDWESKSQNLLITPVVDVSSTSNLSELFVKKSERTQK